MPLIVLEGPEGVGKSTQLELLAARISRDQGSVVTYREPGATPLGELLRNAVLHSSMEIAPAAESLIFMAARAQLVAYELKPALEHGKTVLLDRFFLSTYAYQSAGRGLPIERIRSANSFATSSAAVSISAELKPDLTILLSLPVEEGLKRATKRSGPDRMESADAEFHKRVATAFAEYATPEWQAKHMEAGLIVAIDATGSEEQVHGRIIAAVRAALPKLLR